MGTQELMERRKRQRQESAAMQARLRAEANAPIRIPPSSHGPGAWLKRILATLNVYPTKACSCGDHARQMDAMGWRWCQQHVRTVERWLTEEKENRGLTCAGVVWGAVRLHAGRAYVWIDRRLFAVAIRGLIRLAIWQARRHGH